MNKRQKQVSSHTCPCPFRYYGQEIAPITVKKNRKWVGDLCIALAGFLLIVALAAAFFLPQLREKGTRYGSVHDIQNGEVLMVAHRGLSGMELENSLPAFVLAGQNDYYGIEADVRVTKDGKYIITHDDDMTRIAGLNIRIEESTFDELRALEFESPYGDEGTYFLPTLEEYITACKSHDKQAVLEYKGNFTAAQAVEVAGQVEALGWFDRTTFISFSRDDLLDLRAAYPNANAQYIVQEVQNSDVEFMIENNLDANFCWISVNPFRVKKLHDAGLKVNVWTVDGYLCAYLMMLFGVDMITTNILV